MKPISLLPAIAIMLFGAGSIHPCKARQQAPMDAITSVKVSGHVGKKIDLCFEHRVKALDIHEMVDVFARQDEKHNKWGSEFWGKWIQGAIGAYRYNGDEQLFRLIQESSDGIIGHQLPDGYIGNYDRTRQLQGWDVWGRKYVMLGLLENYRLTGNKKALKAACRLLDYTMTQIGQNKANIYDCGLYKGMAAASILEPVVYLFNETGKRKYLDFAQFIVNDWEQPGGPCLIAKSDVPVAQRFPVTKSNWWSKDNGQKAYEMMSCYVGLLELSKATGRTDYADIVRKVVRHIEQEEINICGSGASMECWYGGHNRQTQTSFHTMETCVGFTWMQLNNKLLQMTGDAHYADNIEKTFYNAILAAMKEDGSQILKYTPLEGHRMEGELQCGLHINCCNANGPRAFAMIPSLLYSMHGDSRLSINLYMPSQVKARVGGHDICIEQVTRYPADGHVSLSFHMDQPVQMALALRIPAWSQSTSIKVNGQATPNVQSGTYLTLNRQWKEGDKVELQLDMRTHLVQMGQMQALERGPIVLARDSRLADGFVDESLTLTTDSLGCVDVHSVEPASSAMWMVFETNALTGPYKENVTVRPIRFCDFSSAGNTWDPSVRYRVWIPQTLDIRLDHR